MSASGVSSHWPSTAACGRTEDVVYAVGKKMTVKHIDKRRKLRQVNKDYKEIRTKGKKEKGRLQCTKK